MLRRSQHAARISATGPKFLLHGISYCAEKENTKSYSWVILYLSQVHHRVLCRPKLCIEVLDSGINGFKFQTFKFQNLSMIKLLNLSVPLSLKMGIIKYHRNTPVMDWSNRKTCPLLPTQCHVGMDFSIDCSPVTCTFSPFYGFLTSDRYWWPPNPCHFASPYPDLLFTYFLFFVFLVTSLCPHYPGLTQEIIFSHLISPFPGVCLLIIY